MQSSLYSGKRLPGQSLRNTGTYRQEPFRFQDLAAELRNRIYSCYLEDRRIDCFLDPSVGGKLFTKDPLASVSRAVRQEFLHAAFDGRMCILAIVNNLDFRHIVTFLNSLSDVQLAKLRKETHAWDDFTIELTFEGRFNPVEARKLLQRWLNRIGHPTKKGADLDATFIMSPYKPPAEPWKVRAVRTLLDGDLVTGPKKGINCTPWQWHEIRKIWEHVRVRQRYRFSPMGVMYPVQPGR